mmetsp:Transcript_16103/g.50035  ORF Transcript_16103/g.50035 Transcript_16103/m.50035 type:complete len:314 (-) Transcript_16103:589-1530(-)
MPCAPPICLISCGGSICMALVIVCAFMLWLSDERLPPRVGIRRPFILPNILPIVPCCSMRPLTSSTGTPAPRAMRRMRASSKVGLDESISLLLSESMITSKRLNRCCVTASLPAGSTSFMPGIMPITLLSGPMPLMLANCSRMVRNVKTPEVSFLTISSCASSSPMMSVTLSMRPVRSPIPSSLLTKPLGSNRSNSSMCSPTPTNVMGLCVAATALMAPPPLAWPSILVTITLPTSTLCLKAVAWSAALWPMCESITKTTSSGSTASCTASISSKSAASCLCRPLVSTIMSVLPSSRNLARPSRAITLGSVSV